MEIKDFIQERFEELKDLISGMSLHGRIDSQSFSGSSGPVVNGTTRGAASSLMDYHRGVVQDQFPNLPLGSVDKVYAMHLALSEDDLAVSLVILFDCTALLTIG